GSVGRFFRKKDALDFAGIAQLGLERAFGARLVVRLGIAEGKPHLFRERGEHFERVLGKGLRALRSGGQHAETPRAVEQRRHDGDDALLKVVGRAKEFCMTAQVVYFFGTLGGENLAEDALVSRDAVESQKAR